MVATSPDALAHALSQSRSRRDALRLVAGGAIGGALALGSRTVPEARALTEFGSLLTGWTQLAGTTGWLLGYRARDGFANGWPFVDGAIQKGGNAYGFSAGWTRIVGANRSLFFYRQGDGLAASGYLDADGRFVQPEGAVYAFSPNLRFFPGTHSGRFLLYAKTAGNIVPLLLTAAGYYDGFGPRAQVGSGWTHGAGVGSSSFILYRADTGEAATGRVDATLTWIPRATYRFDTGWTHVVGTYGGGLLFYNQLNGVCAYGFLEPAGAWTQLSDPRTTPNFGTGWTRVVGAGSRGVLIWSKKTGRGLGGYLTGADGWVATATYAGGDVRPT